MNILIVEDELAIAFSIKKSLVKVDNINLVDITSDYHSALSKATSGIYDVILVDILLEGFNLSGIDLCEAIREKDDKIPIIIITGMQSINFLQQAFKNGANDYIKKPFNFIELRLRIGRWVELSQNVRMHRKIVYKEIDYDVNENEFYYRDRLQKLTKKNKYLLSLFIKKPEILLSNKYLKEKIWGDFDDIEKVRNLRSNIQSLRQSLDPECSKWIRTVRGEGYTLKK